MRSSLGKDKMSQNKVISPWWTRTALLAVTLGVIVVGLWILFRPAVPPERSRELRKGMNTAEVSELLGKPDQVRNTAEGGSEWLYGSPLKLTSLQVEFSRDEHMIDCRQDEL